jgi:type IV pilus assembly protein PilB
MATPTDTASSVPVKTGVFAYGAEALSHAVTLFTQANLADFLDIKTYNLSRIDQIECDLALVMFDPTRDISQYKHDLAVLKVIKKISIVMLLASDKQRQFLEEHKSEIHVDDLYYLPIPSEQFGKIVMTRVAAIRIARERDMTRAGFGRTSQSLGEILVDNKIINALQLKKALDLQKRRPGKRLGDVLVELGCIDEEQKLHFLSSQLNVPLAQPRQYTSAEGAVVALIPEETARRYTCIALERNENELAVAMTDVLDLRMLDELRNLTHLAVRPLLGQAEDITAALGRFYRGIGARMDAPEPRADTGGTLDAIPYNRGEIYQEEAASGSAEALVDTLIAGAVRDRASDIHVEPAEAEAYVRYRVDGVLHRVMAHPMHSHQAVVTLIKQRSRLDVAERRLPQNGRMTARVGPREIGILVSVVPCVFGEKAVLKILDKSIFKRTLSQLGLCPRDLAVFNDRIRKPGGLIVAAGPAGSGTTTTLYAALQALRHESRSIVTIEDPVEHRIDGATQVQVNGKTNLTFDALLQSMSGQDPDVVLIGEIRDEETATVAAKMALSRHLVFAALNAGAAASALARFVDINVSPLVLASSLSLIVAQRLLRKICPECRKPFRPAPELAGRLGLPSGFSGEFFRGKGCDACNGTGFSGRTGIFEVLPVSEEIRRAILRSGSTGDIQTIAEREGMKTLLQSGIDLVLQGETTIEQVIAAL